MAVTELRFGSMKYPDLKDLFDSIEGLIALPKMAVAEAPKEPALVK